LDVKATKWHDEFSVFKNGVKDLDVMYQNIINFAFESVATVQQGVEMLEAFDQLSKRETIKTVVRKKALFVMVLFVQELDATKQEFDNMKRVIPMPIGHGKYSGQCIWVRALVHRIEKMREWIDKMVFVDDAIKR
jgi:dynein heavy chain